jgi:hypothetical protein
MAGAESAGGSAAAGYAITTSPSLADYIILNLDAETKKPIIELGRKIEKNPIDKINLF